MGKSFHIFIALVGILLLLAVFRDAVRTKSMREKSVPIKGRINQVSKQALGKGKAQRVFTVLTVEYTVDGHRYTVEMPAGKTDGTSPAVGGEVNLLYQSDEPRRVTRADIPGQQNQQMKLRLVIAGICILVSIGLAVASILV